MHFSLLYSKKVKAMIQRKYNMGIHDTADILGETTRVLLDSLEDLNFGLPVWFRQLYRNLYRASTYMYCGL